MRTRLFVSTLALGMVVARVDAQTGNVSGRVYRDSANHAIGGATVSISSINRAVRTNYLGEFWMDRVPAGKYTLTIRFLGFRPLTDTVTVNDGQTFEGDYVLTESPVMLDSQRVVANAELAEPHVAEFEERRKLGFGYFIDTKQLRKLDDEGRPLMNYLSATLPSLRTYRPDPVHYPNEWYLGGGHGATSFKGKDARCPIAIYIDGAAFYLPSITHGDRVPDISSWTSQDYSAVEYYPSAATVPPRYATTQQSCGVLLLWRRYKR